MSPTLGRARKAKTPCQTRILKKIFEEKRQLDREEIQHLASSLNMSKRVINDWFRYKLRKERRQLVIGEQYPLLQN